MSIFDSPEWAELQQVLMKAREDREKECDEYWDSLKYEDQLKAFYSVVKRIYQGEIKEKGTYRYILYEVFQFGPEAYELGMDCGFMYLHNAIVDAEEDNK